MERLGALAAFGTAIFWTASAIAFEGASKRVGALAVNFWKVSMALVLLTLSILLGGGTLLPFAASGRSWSFLALSGLIGFVIADYFLFNAYVLIGSRVTVVFQALTPLFAAGFGYLLLGERMRPSSLLAMGVVVAGILLLVLARNAAREKAAREAGLPAAEAAVRVGAPRPSDAVQAKGYLFAFLSTVFQALGLVTSKLGLEGIDALSATQIRVLAAIVGFAVQTLLLRRTAEVFARPLREGRVVLRIALGSVVGPFLGVACSLFALQHADVGTASTLMALTPVLIIPPSLIFLRQRAAPLEILGAAVAVAGTSLFFAL